MIEQRPTGSLRAFIYALLIHAALAAALAPDIFTKKPKPLPEGQRVRVAFIYAPDAQDGAKAVPKQAAPALQKKPEVAPKPVAPQPVKTPEPVKPEPVEVPKPKPVPKKPEPVKAPEPKPEPKKPEPVKVPEPKPEPKKPEPVKAPKPKPVPKKPEPVKAPEPKPEPKKPEPVKAPEPKPEPQKPEPVKAPEPKPEPIKPAAPAPPLLRKPEPPKPAPAPKKEEPKKEAPKKPSPPVKKKTDKAFDDLTKSLSQPAPKKPSAASSDFDNIGALLDGLDSGSSAARMSAGAVRDVIKSRIVPNWNVPMTAQGLNMPVRISIKLRPDGSLATRPTALPSPQDGDPIYERLKISALQAVERTAPFIGLPAPNYQGSDGWNHVELRFSPQDIKR